MYALQFHIIMLFRIALYGLLFWASSAFAEGNFVPPSTFVFSQTQPLPIRPSKIVISHRNAYVIGEEDGSGQLLRLNVDDLEIEKRRSLDVSAEDMITSFGGKFVYVIGKRGDETVLLVLNASLETLGEVVMPTPIAYPSLSLADTNIIVVAGLRTEQAEGAFLVFDASNANNASSSNTPTLIEQYRAKIASNGVAAAWLDISQVPPTAFLNSVFGSGLLAIGLSEKGDVNYSNFSFGKSGTIYAPFTTFALMPNQLCLDGNLGASFLIADSARRILSLAAYDPDFRSLDVVSLTQLTLEARPNGKPLSYYGIDILQPTNLLVSSCNHSVIWAGNLNSNEIEQFTFNTNLMAIEKVGTIDLHSRPSGLAMNVPGQFALVISANGNTVTRFQNGDGSIVGKAAERELQRLLFERGYSVGTIDGIIGAKTMRAVARFQKRNDVQLNINRDLKGALKAIQSIPESK